METTVANGAAARENTGHYESMSVSVLTLTELGRPPAGSPFPQFTALTSLILSDPGKLFNDCFLMVFQRCAWVGGPTRPGTDSTLMYGAVNGCFGAEQQTLFFSLFAVPGKHRIRSRCGGFVSRRRG